MGVYFNPNNESFTRDKNSKIYVDKTGLLEFLNNILGTNSNCIAVSHARRFGKSHAAGMIDAYYSLGEYSDGGNRPNRQLVPTNPGKCSNGSGIGTVNYFP